jgi:hypothetical protein
MRCRRIGADAYVGEKLHCDGHRLSGIACLPQTPEHGYPICACKRTFSRKLHRQEDCVRPTPVHAPHALSFFLGFFVGLYF